MPSTLAQLEDMVKSRVPNTDDLMPSPKRIEALGEAVETYSRHRPRTVVADVAGSGTYDLPLPEAWVSGFSAIDSVEYPAGQREPVMVERRNWTLYQMPAQEVLRLLCDTPTSGETVRLTFSVPHTLNPTTSTLPEADVDAVANLAAGVLCEWISTHYSQSTDSSIRVDSVDHKSQAAEYAMRAKRLRNLGLEHLGVSSGQDARGTTRGSAVAAASATRHFTRRPRHGGDRLTHSEPEGDPTMSLAGQQDLITRYMEADAQAKHHRREADELKAEIQSRMGQAQLVRVGPYAVHWTAFTRVRCNAKKLREDFPNIFDLVSSTESSRRFEVKVEGAQT